MTRTPAETVDLYFTAWRDGDTETFRSILADDVRFTGPLAEIDNADDCARSLGQLAAATTDLVVRRRWIDGDDVITWFDLAVGDTPATPVANWSHVEHGLITRIQVTFDPRGMLGSG
jgi:ketosteroid isomerase-like protein